MYINLSSIALSLKIPNIIIERIIGEDMQHSFPHIILAAFYYNSTIYPFQFINTHIEIHPLLICYCVFM